MGAWYIKCVGDGEDIGGEDNGDDGGDDGGDSVRDDSGDAEGDRVGEDGGDSEARRPVRLRSSGFVDKFSGSSETRKK